MRASFILAYNDMALQQKMAEHSTRHQKGIDKCCFQKILSPPLGEYHAGSTIKSEAKQ